MLIFCRVIQRVSFFRIQLMDYTRSSLHQNMDINNIVLEHPKTQKAKKGYLFLQNFTATLQDQFICMQNITVSVSIRKFRVDIFYTLVLCDVRM